MQTFMLFHGHKNVAMLLNTNLRLINDNEHHNYDYEHNYYKFV